MRVSDHRLCVLDIPRPVPSVGTFGCLDHRLDQIVHIGGEVVLVIRITAVDADVIQTSVVDDPSKQKVPPAACCVSKHVDGLEGARSSVFKLFDGDVVPSNESVARLLLRGL